MRRCNSTYDPPADRGGADGSDSDAESSAGAANADPSVQFVRVDPFAVAKLSRLMRVSRIGHDLALDQGVGTCGKDGQGVPVGVGLPTIRVDALTVGGTEG